MVTGAATVFVEGSTIASAGTLIASAATMAATATMAPEAAPGSSSSATLRLAEGTRVGRYALGEPCSGPAGWGWSSALDLLKPLFETYTCNPGTTVLQQGEPANHLYLVISGTVEMTYKPYDGIPITITHVKKDGLFGWSAVVGSEKYTSSAIAIENLEALRVRGSELRGLCVEHPEAGKEILERLACSVSSRVQDAQEQVKSILKQGMKNK